MRCSYCGAPLDVTPDSVVVVCRYCGRANFLAGEPRDVLAVPTLPASEIVRRAVERTRRDLNLRWRISEINFASPDLYYLPFYLVDVKLSATYQATVVVTYTKTVYMRGQPRTQIVTKVVRVGGRVALADVVAVLARRAAWGLSVDRLTSHFFKTGPEPKPLAEVASGGQASAFMAGEFTAERAKAKAVRALIPRLLAAVDRDAEERARAAVGVFTAAAYVRDKTVDYEVERLVASPLTYLPLWVMPYFYRGSSFRYYIAGWDGEVVLAEEPVFVEHKAASLLAAAAAGGLAGGLGYAALGVDPYVGAAVVAAGGALSYMAAGGFLKSRRVEK
ncbi:conserved hypothetical protein [Pyrobaculum islandicum DSM 4184]|uniref:Zinc finger, TFIIB-type domain protein n=1 Tax=Pyrobaculum islandicum (strain DSM 4184 / JCM 9189 / GEO3) TaxID=384616 RepID=A1RQG7_PYRIL|nr:hypothetical protein [Pyrobaculum islandicum]ABL87199.1 conserved hypothetical protein [Pyrobaculum islandicum DSM 4184]